MKAACPRPTPARATSFPGQVVTAGVFDDQVRRCAYTVNQAIIPRNKFSPAIDGYGGGAFAQYVRAPRVRKSSDIILGTEFWEDYTLVSEGNDGIVKSPPPRPRVSGPRQLGRVEPLVDRPGTERRRHRRATRAGRPGFPSPTSTTSSRPTPAWPATAPAAFKARSPP
jgi:hypothetical protein